MVEVFRTDVGEDDQARMLVEEIHRNFVGYEANFDLQDCDKILRVRCNAGKIDVACLIDLLNHFGFRAEVLPDNYPVTGTLFLKHVDRYVQLN